MRVIQVVNVRWFNATAWYGLELARLGNAAGHPGLVLGLPDSDPLRRAEALGLPHAGLPLNARSPLAWPGLFARMRGVVRDFQPDVVNCHRGEAFAFWAALRALSPPAERFALVRTRGDQRPPRANPVNARLYAQAADAVIATNTRTARHLATAVGVPAARLATILGGVDTGRFAFDPLAREQVRAALGYAREDVVVGLLGRFDRVKGQRECIEAVAALAREGLPARLLLIGFAAVTSGEEVRVWAHAAGLDAAGLDERVRVTGRVDDVPAHLAALDVGVIASLRSETIARAALEIMACDRPLVSTDVGVMPDLLPREALCPAGDVPALAALLRRAVTEPDWRERLREINRERMRSLDGAAFWAETLAVYERARDRARIGARTGTRTGTLGER
jgi:glycosyltransferase involved in cell wall biosynthesis